MNDPSRFFLALAIFLIFVVSMVVRASFTSGHGHPRAEPAQIENDFRYAAAASRIFQTERGRWPQSWEELREKTPGKFKGIDPWTNREYAWYQFDDGPPFFVSWGADGAPGGENLNADIVGRQLYDEQRAAAAAARCPETSTEPGR